MPNYLRLSIITRRRYRRYRDAAKFAPPVPATGGFPYNRKSVAQLDTIRNAFNPPEYAKARGSNGFWHDNGRKIYND